MGDAIWDKRAPRRSNPPDGRGPSGPLGPSGPRVLTVAEASEGPFAPRMYAYWANAWVQRDTAHVFAGHQDSLPRFYDVNLMTGEVVRRGLAFPYHGTTEGWHWDREGWVYLTHGPQLRRVNPFTLEDALVFDVSLRMPGHTLVQSHSSEDGRAHSATVLDGGYAKAGTVAIRDGEHHYYAAEGALDESQVDASGRWLVIKEDDDNRIIEIGGGERIIHDAEGALGHSDCGHGFMVGEDNQIGACVYVDLATLGRRKLFDTWNMGYVAVRGERCLHSGDSALSLVDLGTGNMTRLVDHGGGSAYDDRVKANLDPSGRVACYMSQGAVKLLVL